MDENSPGGSDDDEGNVNKQILLSIGSMA